MGRNKRRTGITYKLVQLPREEEDEEDDLLVGGEHDVNTSARVELVPEHELRAHTYNPERANTRRHYAPRDAGVENWADEWYEDEGGEEEEDWEEDWEEEEDEEGNENDGNNSRNMASRGDVEEDQANKINEDDDEPLFEDAVEGGVTDDFIRQLVLGTGGGEDAEGDGYEDNEMEDFDWDEEDKEGGELDDEDADLPVDGEVWRLLSEEERAGLMAAHRRGTQRQRKAIPAHVDPTSGKAYPKHETNTRAIDRQFTEMMKEFNADARINEVDTVDLRTQGPLSVNKYLPALQEFVSERAGIDLETADLNKNRGLMHQLRILSHREGAFDVDPHEGGVYFPALPSEKQERFAENFMLETEQIREQAMARIRQREAAVARALKEGRTAEELDDLTAAGAAAVGEEEEQYEIVKLPPRAKSQRLDCETVVSTMSTYYNQPNVIRPPAKTRTHKVIQKVKGGGKHQLSDDDDDSDYDNSHQHTSQKSASAPLIIERVEGETKEEKRLRRQAVKAAQRERRQEKSALKKAYKAVSAEEAAKAAVSSKAKRTVHFS